MPNYFVNWKFLLIAFIILNGCVQSVNKTNDPANVQKLEGQDCSANTDCESSVCDFVKQDFGKCAPKICVTGTQAQGLTNIAFFCNSNGSWESIKNIGESCSFDYQCFQRTDKDCPTCNLSNYISSCKNGVCAEEQPQNECERNGFKKIISKEDSDSSNDGSCFQTIAQRPVFTVCAPCGNEVCDTELESKCNCPEDCQ